MAMADGPKTTWDGPSDQSYSEQIRDSKLEIQNKNKQKTNKKNISERKKKK